MSDSIGRKKNTKFLKQIKSLRNKISQAHMINVKLVMIFTGQIFSSNF